VVDSNRSGLLLVTYLAVLLWHDWRRHVGTMAAACVFLLLTLSRSSLLAAAGAAAWQLIQRQRKQQREQQRKRQIGAAVVSGADHRSTRGLLAVGLAASALVASLTAPLLLSPRVRAESALVLEPLAERFSIEQGSGEDHLRLLARGVATGARSIPTSLQGIGYGSGYLVLQDFFPGDKYGNFHSVYVGIFAESGVLALLVTVLLLALPLALATPQAPLAVAVAVFGVFYAALAEPTFWLAVVLAWLPVALAEASRARPKATSSALAMDSTAPSAS